MDSDVTRDRDEDESNARRIAEELTAIGDASGAVVGTDVTTPSPDQTSNS